MKNNVKSLVSLLPVQVQNKLISIYGYSLYRKRYGAVYKKWFNYYLKKDNSNYQSEIDLQNDRLIELVKFANENSKFYKELYSGINIDEFKGIKDLKKLPILKKEDLRTNISNIYTLSAKKGIKSFTGGTTGKSLEVIFTKEDFQERMAYLDAFKAKLGIDPFLTTKATFSGRDFLNDASPSNNIYWRYNEVYKQKLYSTFHIKESTLPYYIKDLDSFKPEVINGFVSAIYEVALFIKNNAIKLNFTPKAIFTTSETLLPFHRETIETAFNCKIYNQYASSEGAPFVTECSQGNLHYNIDTGVIETTEDGGMLVTSFTTHGTPLIRYDIGDSITFMEGQCACRSSHPLVKEIKGRKVDYLENINGNKISLSHLSDVIKGMPNSVLNVQFCQNKIDEIIILLVVDENLFTKSHEQSIIEAMKYRFGNQTNFIVEKVSNIPREKSGKYSLIKKNIKS